MKTATKSAKANSSRSTITSVRLYPDVLMRLNRLSKKTARTKSYYINQALLEMLEDYEDIQDAKKVLARIEAGKERTYTLEEVERELGL